ncbi:MAG: 4'-phosphopantetheinyl transferase superfamily protein [Pseudomonadales bacterium]
MIFSKGRSFRVKLAPTDLYIWHIPFGGKALLEQRFAPLPSKEESTRAANFTHPELHQCYLKTRWAMRDILGLYLHTAQADIQLRYAKLGKPELIPGAHSLDIRFNLTHSGDGALFAVTLGSEVGIDMERVRQKSRPLRLAKRYFTADTVAQLIALPEKEQQITLLKLWTQYEAYKKAQGVGLRGGEGLLPLSINLQTDQFQPFPRDTGEASNWLVSQLKSANEYVAAVVIKPSCEEIQIKNIDYDAYLFSNR